jgi:hypothetical protein
MLCNVLAPIPGWALSGGNKAPEFESFQPFGLDNMVDPATGDFSYNIPLMNVGFHGINLFYQAGITMDQEATMVGLGWNINSGMIDRNVRGIPDDFNGDEIVKKMSTKPYTTVGVAPGVGAELFGIDNETLEIDDVANFSLALGVYNNSYDGIGFEYSLGPSFDIKMRGQGKMTVGLGINGNSDGGLSFDPSVSYSSKVDKETKKDVGSVYKIGASINSRSGLKSLSLGSNLKILETSKILSKLSKFTSTDISFSKPSYIQDIEFPRKNKSFSFKGTVGGELFGLHGSVKVNGYFTKQYIDQNEIKVPGFGMLYHEKTTPSGLQDFHRKGDLAPSVDVPNLAVPILDGDVFSAVGPGLSGVLQLNRGDLGVVYDRASIINSNSGSLGAEVGAGNLVHIGLDYVNSNNTDVVRPWTMDNNLQNVLSFKDGTNNQSQFEKAILKNENEITAEIPTSGDLFSQIRQREVFRPNIIKTSGFNYKADGTVRTFPYDGNNNTISNIQAKRNARLKRSNNITFKTFKEAKLYGFSKSLPSISTIYDELNGIAKDHHITEIIVENEDGYKYIYGIPVYNLEQTEETFAVNGDLSNKNASKNTGLIPFTATHNSKENGNGKDHFYSATKTPPYATSYLLTAIISKDYEDITGNGPSPDDYGDYVAFEYKKVIDYNWKTPTSQHSSKQASLNIGFETDYSDDKGHIIYGIRQQYRPSKINNKTEVAVYDYYKSRNDAHGETVDGSLDTNKITPLKSITKYAFNDYEVNRSNAEKVKSVHFEYDYELCKGVYNNLVSGLGKLTLKKLYILNGESSKGRFSPYEFFYGFNPNYQPKCVNRFGSYQPRRVFEGIDDEILDLHLSTVDFPYVPQHSRGAQNEFASAWCLNKINLPSGGEINVNYESDDYAYVQDKNAMQLIRIKGFSSNSNGAISWILRENNYLHFDIEDSKVKQRLQNANSTERKEILKEYYLKDITDNLLYYRVYGELKPEGSFDFSFISSNAVNEYVPGWARIDKSDYGINENSGEFTGFIKLQEVCLNERKVIGCNVMINPIKKTLMQALRLNLPAYLYGTESFSDDDSSESGIVNTINALTTHITQAAQFLSGGVNNWMNANNYGNRINAEKSFVRLYCPSKAKIAGSHRVSSIIMKDNFSLMTNNVHKNGIYGKQYDYSSTENILGKDIKISSGVAAYEPAVGGDENPFFNAIPFKEEYIFAPDNTKYQEEPMMEDYYPSPQIIYSKITVKDLYSPSGQINDVEVYQNTGFVENHFHTYKEFPIKTDKTDHYYGDPYKTRSWIPLKLITKDFLTASQGYYFHQTMMHGKPKANYTYNSSGQLISGEESYYKQNNDGTLNYEVPVMISENQALSIKNARMGLSYSMFLDTREHESNNKTIGVQGNVEITGVFPFIGVIPVGIPSYQQSDTRFRSIVLVKSIRQQGILYKTVAINGTSRITTEHLLWDAETGQPIVSQTMNEFDDPVYQVNLPAHLAYKGMGLAYQNIHATFTNVAANNGIVTNNTAFISATQEGDLLINNSNTNPSEYWVLRKSSNSVYLIDKNGNPASFANDVLRIEESGFSNQAGAAIASYITRKNPLVGDRLVLDEAKEIIDANATTYKEKWQSYCDIVNTKDGVNNGGKGDGKPDGRPDTRCLNASGIVNPFLLNIKGNWRPEKSYVFQTDRKSTNNIRVDGPYITKPDNYNNTFTNFWQETGGQYVATPGKWTWTTENTLVSPFGNELEARDPLNRYSAELYGYNSQKVVAVAANARYQDIAYYGAEVPLQNGVDIYGQYLDGNNLCRPLYHLNILDGKRTKHNDNVKPNSGEYYLKFLSGKMNVLNFNTSSVAEIVCDPNNQGPYKMTDCDCIKQFKPTQGKKYLLSAWLYAPCLQDDACTNKPYIEVSLSGGGSAATFKIEEYGPVIEGWRKVSGTFDINSQQQGKISIKNSMAEIYMDDLRIHPYHATMKTYNYDLKTLRFTFEHDDNNFFTRYDYAKDGTLQRVSKQTERGIQTLQESTFGQQKTN